MNKRLIAILSALSIVLSLLTRMAYAFSLPEETDYWVSLTQAETTAVIDRISNKSETADIVLICFPSDGLAPVPTAVAQFASYANDKQIKLYYYTFSGGPDDASRIDGALSGLFDVKSENWPDWPIAVTYNTSTRASLSREYVASLQSLPDSPINGLVDLMRENGVASGSSGSIPGPGPDPNPDPNPNPGPDIPQPPAPVLPDGMDAMGWEVLRLVNQHRMSIGRVPLSVFDALQDTASLRAQEIYVDYRADHTRPDGRICWTAYQECGVLYHFSAENIASGQTTSASVMNSWLHSPGHRRNIESPNPIHIGVGHYYGLQPSAGKHNWTQDFAAANNCRFTGLDLSAAVISGRPGTALEDLLTDANLAVTTSCYRHGFCTLPLIAAMCSGYDIDTTSDQTITVTYGGQTTQLTIAARHTWDSGQITSPPTCMETGTMVYTCTDANCGVARSVTVPATGHSFAGTVCDSCGTGVETSLEDVLATNLAPEGLSEQEAVSYAAQLAQEELDRLNLSGYIPTVNVIAYVPPVDETPDNPGEYGYLDYTLTISQPTARSVWALRIDGDTSPVLRLDIPPTSSQSSPSDIHETCIITFDPCGGTVSPVEITAGLDGTLSNLPTPVRSGYTFQGWYTEPAGGTAVTTYTTFSGDAAVYAQWLYSDPGSVLPSDFDFDTGFGGYFPSYNAVSVPSVSGGKVTVTPSSASTGERVTITVIPDDGYKLSSLTVANTAGEALALTEQADGRYIFTMPGGQVTVSAVFLPVTPSEPEDDPEPAWENPFKDVSPAAWYYEAVKFVNLGNLMDGIGDGKFAPDTHLTRAMLAQILYNHAGSPSVSKDNRLFLDVPDGIWYADAVSWAASSGIVNGYGGGLFGPENLVTREQMTVMLWRCSGSPEAADISLPFSDSHQISDYARGAISWAHVNGLVVGDGSGLLAPNGQVTRAQAAQILTNYLSASSFVPQTPQPGAAQ